MEGEAAAALQILVQNLIDHSKKEISLIRGLDKEAAKLSGSLDMIQQFLNDAETRTIPGGAVKSWLNKLEDVAFDADNVLDQLNYHLLSTQINPTKPIEEKVLSCFSSINSIARPRNMALRIQEINENLESIDKEATELGLVGRLADVPSLVDAAFETDSVTDHPIFIGRDDDVSEIVKILTNTIRTGDKTYTLAIVGMRGLGKTTLTRKVFNHLKEKTRFGSHIWVHVSQIFDPILLFKKILKGLISSDQVEVESREDIVNKLKEALKDKTYLLVLDDVWNQDLPKWEDFINSLMGATSVKGNAIVVTTRSTNVASTVGALHTHQLKGLSEEECWSIIKEKTFGENDCPLEFEAIGRKIAGRCQGLPLAANVVGGVLRDISEEKWLSIEEKWLSRDEGDSITKILRLSFDNLSPPSLKKCFAYCSIFPKGKEIRKHALIEYWTAEGFLQEDGSNDMESVGNKFINVLVQNSLLQVAKRDGYGNVKVCQMHDLVHDLTSSVLGSSCSAAGMRRVRYMTHQHQSSSIPKEVAKHLRTLFLEGEISDNMVSDFECLHVLGFGRNEVTELPSSIRKLIHLRDIDISKTRIHYLPDWIGELYHLQTLRTERSYLEKLPSTIKYLVNLRHLYISNYVELPVGIGRLTSLQTLTQFTVGDENGCKFKELVSLNNLTRKLNINKLERVGDYEDVGKANLYKKSKITKLSLRWGTHREVETRNDENVLEGLQPNSNLKNLVIDGFNGKRFPSWTLKMTVRDGPRGSWVELNKLMSISLLKCSECEEIPMMGQLPNLKCLRLASLSNVKCINPSFYGLMNKETRIVFPALKKLELVAMPEMAEWVELAAASEVKVFPQLQHLEITECKKLMTGPTHLWSYLIKHLEIRRIGSYKTLANIFEIKLRLLTKLSLEGIDDLECLPDWIFYNNPSLSKMKILHCPNLRELPDGLGTLSYLEELIIWDCPRLERIGDSGGEQSKSQGSLRHLEICECDALVYFSYEILQSSLMKLELRSLRILQNPPSLINFLPKLPRLTQLIITGVPQFMATCCVEFSPFCNLTSLETDVSIGGSMEILDAILQACCHSLNFLYLKGMEIWEKLPESVQYLTALSWLKLENFGMEELPEWLGNLSSLYDLYICNCKKLRHLPSTDAMQRLERLKRLYIDRCPELVIQSDAADSEWPKISHIPDIRIDHFRISTAKIPIDDSRISRAIDSEESRWRKDLCLRCF